MKKFIIIFMIAVLLNCLLNVKGQYQFANKTILQADRFGSLKFTAGDQINFTIPSNVNEIKVIACGGNGDEEKKSSVRNDNQGGKGECLQVLLNVKPKEVLFINVGGAASLTMGGYNGSGTSGVNSGGAGGATTIRNSSVTLLSAAGGGEGQ